MEILMKRLFLFLFLIKLLQGNNEIQPIYVLRSSKNNCWKSLTEPTDLPDDRFSASSFYQNKSSFQAHQARLLYIFRSNSQPDNGNAWCPNKRVGTDIKEWIQVDFKSIKIINGIYTKGRGEGNYIEFVPTIRITYQRESNGRVYEYRTTENQTIIPINTDARTQSRTSFIPAIIASSIKIYPVDPHNAIMICIKFAMFGCSFDDSPKTYSTLEGEHFEYSNSEMIPTYDRYYDGEKTFKSNEIILQNGLGLLTDNRAWVGNLDGLKEPYFIGWIFTKESSYQYIPIHFYYEKTRNFTKLEIFSHILPNKTIDIFSKINLIFKTDSKLEFEISKDVSLINVQINRVGGAIFTMELLNKIGNNVEIHLYIAKEKWLFVSEINFESTLAEDIAQVIYPTQNPFQSGIKADGKKNKTSDSFDKHFVHNKINPNFYPNISGRDIFSDSEKDTTLTVATIVGLILLVVFILIIGIILYKMKQKRQYKKNSKIQYMIGNEIGSIYQQYSQTEKIKSFLSPNLQQAHSMTSDNSSFDSPPGRILDASVYSSLPHKTNKDSKSIREDETFLLKEYGNAPMVNQSSLMNICPFTNKDNTLKNAVLTTYSWSTNDQSYKNGGQDYASATLFPMAYQGFQYKRSSISSGLLQNDYPPSLNPSPYHVLTSSPLFSNSPLGMSQLPATIQIIANPYFDHVDNKTNNTPNEFSTPIASHKSFTLISNDSRNPSPYSMSKNSFLTWTSPEANYFSNFDFSKLIQIQSVCGHISFGSADFDSLDSKRPVSFIDSKLPVLPLTGITITELISQGQYGQNKKAILNDSIIRPKNSANLISDNNQVIVTILNENNSPDIKSQFQEEIRIRLRLSDPNVIAVLALISDSADSENQRVFNHHFGIITECYMNLHHYIRTQTTDQNDVPISSTEYSYTLQNPDLSNNYLNYGSLIFIASQIASGMKHMEKQGILHRDLACRSCMVSSNLQVKIGNGGRQINSPFEADYLTIPLSDFTTIHLPIRWMAPESLYNAKFSSKSDVWAFGVTLWEVLTHCNQQPYFYWSNSLVMENLYNVLLAQNSQFHYLTRPKNCPKEIYDMIRECWHPIEDYRPNFHEIHMFLQRKCLGFYNTDIGYTKS